MDARAVAEAAGVGVGTLNVWVQRGLIPGMKTGASGRQRDFDLDTATYIAIVSELVIRMGITARTASTITKARDPTKKKLLLFSDISVRPGTAANAAVLADLNQHLRRAPLAV